MKKAIVLILAVFAVSCEPEEVTDCEGMVDAYADLDCKNDKGEELNLFTCSIGISQYGEGLFGCANLETCEKIFSCNEEVQSENDPFKELNDALDKLNEE